MANTFAPNGMQPVRRLDGAAWTGNQTLRKALSSAGAMFRGDPVIALSSGYITQAGSTEISNGAAICGVFNGCYYLPTAFGYQRWSNSWPGSGAAASTEVTCAVVDDPQVVFEIQSSSSGAAIAQADLYSNANLASSAGNALSGFSQWSLGALSLSSAAPVMIVGFITTPTNDNASAQNRVEVAWNSMFYKNSARTGL